MSLSTRAHGLTKPNPLFRLWDILSDLYEPDSNPNGYVSLGVAENALLHDTLHEHIHKNLNLDTNDFTYGDGKKALRATLANFFNKRFNPALPVEPAHIAVTNGCTAAIEHLGWAFGNPGDGFLLGRPYYGAFVTDITLRFGNDLLTVDFDDQDPLSKKAVQKYEAAILAAKERRQRVAGLFLCQPHNPLGRCYSRETMIELMRLCNKYKIHFISDEIYALSVFENTVDTQVPVNPFTSALAIDTADIIDPALVHVIWGVSKDFGANGIRFGCIVSQRNPVLHSAITPVSLFSSSSALTDNAVHNFLSDEKWTDNYIKENNRLLASRYRHVTDWAKRNGIEYAPGVNAAFFLWVNLGKAYQERNGKAAGDVTQVVMDLLLDQKVFLASGAQFGAEQPGWFRIVFSQPEAYLDLGLERVMKAIQRPTSKI